MTTSDWINMSLSILSFILAAISVITVVLTLRQNNKMIEESSRPYISVYGDDTNFSSPQFYIVLKNFGKTGAIIKDFSCDIDLKKYSYVTDWEPFQNIIGTMLAPNQNFICAINSDQMNKDNIDILNFKISYMANKKTYTENYVINYKALRQEITAKVSMTGKELKAISYTLQEMVQRDL